MNQNRAFSWKKKKVITGRENFLVNRKKFVRYSYLPEKDCWGRLVKGSWSKRRLRQHQYFGWSHDQIFHHWATRHSNVPGLWKVCFLFMKWVRRICGRGWRTSTLMWAWDLPDRCLRQKNFRREFPWRLRIWNLIPLTHQCLNTLESADIMLWGTHALIYFYFIKKIYWCTVDWPTYQFRRHKRWGFSSWVGKIPWRRKWQPPPVFFFGNPMDRWAWRATVHWVTKSWTRLSNQRTTIITHPQDPGCCSQAAVHRLATLSQVSPTPLYGCLLWDGRVSCDYFPRSLNRSFWLFFLGSFSQILRGTPQKLTTAGLPQLADIHTSWHPKGISKG